MSFEKAMSKMKFDTRLLEYNLSQGFISKEDHQKFLSQLEDCSHLIATPASESSTSDEDVSNEESH